MAHLHALPIGHELEGYRIERVLGAGGFGITYKAIEAMIGRAVAIKEYLPSSVAARAVDSLTVHPLVEADNEVFRWGLKRFRNEARTLVSFHHPNIVPVYRYFEANGTAYLVMAYEEGASLAEILKNARTLAESEILEFLDPLLDGVAEVHKAGFLHRDIKPANIVIRAGGNPVLIDFGAARQALGAKSQSMHAIVSPGYAPFEQYSNTAAQGPYTDIYALGATLYCCVTGMRPIEATDRMAGAPLRAAAELAHGRYSETLLAAIDRALALMPEDRPQTVAAWREELAAQPARVSDSRLAPRVASPTTSVTAPPAKPRPSRRAFYVGLAAGAVVLVGAGGFAAVRALSSAEEEKRQRAEQKRRQDAEDEARRQREAAARERQAAARQRAEAAAEKARIAQRRALEAGRLAFAARQKALAAAECARQAAIRARNRQAGHYMGQLTNGSYYEGEWDAQANRSRGCGILVEANGTRFEGQFANGLLDGHGIAMPKAGQRYEGAYSQGNVTGYGVFRFIEGHELQGSAVKGIFGGPGVLILASGNRYEGELRDTKMSGSGIYRWADGRVYEGEFSDDNRHGLGVEIAANGAKTHGRWEKGVYKGLE